MARISLRLNQNEEKMINYLVDYYEQDKSSLIKFSLKELYEDIIDRKIIDEFEKKQKNKKIKFIESDQITNMLKKPKKQHITNG
jgi:Arc/MetJ-type ribon-helix-helix transcriptional regulator